MQVGSSVFFFFQAEDGIRDYKVTGVQTCALPIFLAAVAHEGGSRVVIGFAAETENVIENARKKLKEKGADLMVANDVSASDSGFDVDHNRIALVSSEGVVELPLLSKQEAAESIIDAAMKIRSARPLSVA